MHFLCCVVHFGQDARIKRIYVENVALRYRNISFTETRIIGDHCVKTDRIRNYSGPCFPVFGLKNTERYCLSLRIQPECGKIPPRITPNMDSFNTVDLSHFQPIIYCYTP